MIMSSKIGISMGIFDGIKHQLGMDPIIFNSCPDVLKS